jgi:general stress protein YciG
MTKPTGNIKKRGFGSMSPERKREIAIMGGKAAHAKGTAHQFTTAEARAAGRKGGRMRAAKFAAQNPDRADPRIQYDDVHKA